MSPSANKPPIAERLSSFLEKRSSVILAATLLSTAALSVPFILMQPTSSASQEPPGEVFEARDLSADRFASAVYRPIFIVEARDGNVLDRSALLELQHNEKRLREDPEVGPKLVTYFDRDQGREVKGTVTIADALDALLLAKGHGGLEGASQTDVDEAVSLILNKTSPSSFALSVNTTRDEKTGRWSSPALLTYVYTDNEALGGGGVTTSLGSDDTTKEEFARAVQELLRGDEENIQVWGLAIDANLTSQEQGGSAGPFIGLTLLAVLVLVGLTFRSYWAVAITGAGLAALMIWLKGLSNLVGLKSDQILSIIVPIAMISFGVDYIFHAIGRYREELAETGRTPRTAFVAGFIGVVGALVVAMASDSAAFLANTTTRIESLVQFGVAAAMATVASFLLLGVCAPLLLMRLEARLGCRAGSALGKVSSFVGSILAALMATATIIVSVFVLPWLGVTLFFGYLLIFLVVPSIIAVRLSPSQEMILTTSTPRFGLGSKALGSVVGKLVRARWVVFPIVAVVTGLSAYGANKIEPMFDVRDFFAETTDFVVALDVFDEHVGEQGGEPAIVYVEADLADPALLESLSDFADRARRIDSDRLARDNEGNVQVVVGVLDVVSDVMGSDVARRAIESRQGVVIEDADNNGIPDTRDQLDALFTFSRATGVPRADGEGQVRSPDEVRTALWVGEGREGREGREMATGLRFRIPGSRVQENIAGAREALEPFAEELAAGLRQHDPTSRAVLTGAPIARQASLDAILWAFRFSIPVAMVLCLIVAALFMRSLRYAIVSTIPVLLVSAWLYGFMYAMGYAVNVVTATIGAISIGIGIDFSVHVTMRFREELARTEGRLAALEAAGSGTGGALAGSALSSVVGFAILAFAPMPMFASYGLLTAFMIVLALVASLFVLPSLLFIVSPRQSSPSNNE